MIWRKHYRSMYEGSMVGAGAVVFALMGYVITHQEYAKQLGAWVIRLNPVLLAAVFGEDPGDVEKAIKVLCSPDKDSTSKLEEGRRLVPLAVGSMEYRVVNGDKYQEMRDYEERRAQNREAQARFRARQKAGNCKPLKGEVKYCRTAEKHGVDEADRQLDEEQSKPNPDYVDSEPREAMAFAARAELERTWKMVRQITASERDDRTVLVSGDNLMLTEHRESSGVWVLTMPDGSALGDSSEMGLLTAGQAVTWANDYADRLLKT